LLSGFFAWRVVMVSLLMMIGALGVFLWEMQRSGDVQTARTLAVNAVVMAEIFYLVSSRSIFASVLNRRGLTANPYVLLSIAACLPLQLAFTHAPVMQALFGSVDLTLLQWLQALAAGLLVLLVAELEKLVIRRTSLGRRLGQRPDAADR
jgi:magnesium-transporting ATPase (P-type)